MSAIVQYPSNILKTPCAPLVLSSKQARDVADALQMALRTHKRKGVGLSAPQINVGVRAFVIDTKFLKLKCSAVFINPEITWASKLEDVMEEGCLSFPDSVIIPVRRPIRCMVKAFNANGAEFTVELDGLAARCVQHECDHLNGKTLLFYATKAQQKMAMKAIAKALHLKIAKAAKIR